MARQNSNKSVAKKGGNTMPITEVIVSNVKWWNDDANATFTLEIPAFGITVYNCNLRYKDNEGFITFPARKDKNGKWWSYVFLDLPEEMKKTIISCVEAE